jgi:hypothetical protein
MTTEMRLSQPEAAVNELSLRDHLWRMEPLFQQIRQRSVGRPAVNDGEFERMARDPAIQRELKEIEAKFALAHLAELAGFAPSSGLRG